jgi:beta-glucosidase
MKNKKLAAFSSMFLSFSVLFLFVFLILNENRDSVNNFLHINTSKVVDEDLSSNIYYEPDVGDHTFSDENFTLLEQMCREEGIEEEREGAVLLYNKNQALPLKDEKNITLLGHASVDPVYKANSAGNYVTEDRPYRINLKSAMENDGFSINEEVYSALENGTAKRRTLPISTNSSLQGYSASQSEEPIQFYQNLETSLEGYKDCCIITLARVGSEGTDLLMDDIDDDGTSVISSLALHQNEEALLSFARKKFSKVIILLNSSNQMEIEKIKEYSDAILAIGQPGLTGFQGVADILSGKTNPSGKLVDTYAVNSLSSPAVVNSGTRTPYFENYSSMDKNLTVKEKAKLASFQAENIYIGYKYYETRYADCIMNRFSAKSDVGSIDGQEWNYSKEISCPFGYGLSYTSFDQEIIDSSVSKDEIALKVRVRNTGTVSGKSVVQAYASTPYGDYECENNVEKSAIVLVGFSKTKELMPNEEEILTLSINPYFLASYDANNAKTYILSEGNYYLSIGNDAHDALNQILQYQNLNALYDENGDYYSNGKKNVVSFYWGFDKETFSTSNGKKVSNLFEDCDINHYSRDEKYTYLSRKDYQSTFPVSQTLISANDEMLDTLRGEFYEPVSSSDSIPEPKNENIPLIAMKGVSLDDPSWDSFIKQADVDDLVLTTAESFTCPSITSLSQPEVYTGDGMDSIGRVYFYEDGTKFETMTFPCKNILTSTWNELLYEKRGNLMGNESLFTKSFENYCIGPNLHRTPFGGRNFEYMSEDSNISYLASIKEVQAMEKLGVHAAPKHFAGNDQETGREGVSVFFNEQAFRENDLRAFEGAVKEGECQGIMQSFERIGLVFASSSSSLNTSLLRNEWGFTGNIVTDATYGATSGYKGHVREILYSGTNQFCLDGNAVAGKRIAKYIKEDKDVLLYDILVESAKNWEYQIVNSCAMNGIAKTSKIVKITPYWFVLFLSVIICFFTLSIFFFVWFVWKNRDLRKHMLFK